MAMARPDWSEIPPDFLDSVLEKLEDDLMDARVRAVCQRWSRAAIRRFRLTPDSGRALMALERASTQGHLTRLAVNAREPVFSHPSNYALVISYVTSALRRSPKVRILDVDLRTYTWTSTETADDALSAYLEAAPFLSRLKIQASKGSDCLARALTAASASCLEDLEVDLTEDYGDIPVGGDRLFTLDDLRSQLERAREPLRRLRRATLMLTYGDIGELQFIEYVLDESDSDEDSGSDEDEAIWSPPEDLAPLMAHGETEVPWLVPLLLSTFPRLERLTLSCYDPSPLLSYLRNHPGVKARGLEVVSGMR
eukprot:jgi/Tetstr1/454205/TSEL_041124.t1